MILPILAYAAGMLSILSPCILPVLPFVFGRAGEPFWPSGLVLLLCMAAAFTGVATLAAFGGGAAVQANQHARLAALVFLAVFALTLLSDRLAQWLMRPLAAAGQRLAGRGASLLRPAPAALIGLATGLLWAPCAGPILGLVLTSAALNGPSVETSLILAAYASGAATSLAVALLAGARARAVLKTSLGAERWLRRSAGAAALASVAFIGAGWDAQFLAQIPLAGAASIEETLLAWAGRGRAAPHKPPSADSLATPLSQQPPASFSLISSAIAETSAARAAPEPPVEGSFPGFAGAVEWLNSPPLSAQALRGKVVLVNFWTFNCINCLHTLPYVRAWAEKYKNHGLVVIGVHTPELPFERDMGALRKALARLKIAYPIVVDNTYAVWRAFGNEYWPAAYFVDSLGRIRHHHFGEGDYENSERVIQALLREGGDGSAPGGFVTVAR